MYIHIYVYVYTYIYVYICKCMYKYTLIYRYIIESDDERSAPIVFYLVIKIIRTLNR